MRPLDDPRTLTRHDPSGMAALIGSFPGQCRSAAAIGRMAALPRALERTYKNIVCTGLGGSAIGADIARSYLAGTAATPIFVNRDYVLPRFVGRQTLVVAASYSGNTEETLSAYRDARSKRAAILAITSGGELMKRAVRDGVPVIVIPQGFPPRAALGYGFFPLLFALAKIGAAGDPAAEADRAIDGLERLRDREIGPAVPAARNPAKRIACALAGSFPVIYAAQARFDAVATRWRGQLAENAKTLSSTHAFPEMNHNEIMGWQCPAGLLRRFTAVILRDAHDHPRVAKRMAITRSVLAKEGIGTVEAWSEGKGLLERIFSLIYTGDYVSLYLAALNKVDPTSIDRINYLKKELSRI